MAPPTVPEERFRFARTWSGSRIQWYAGGVDYVPTDLVLSGYTGGVDFMLT